MKVVVQRVSHASVSVDEETVGEIQAGLLLLVGIGHDDTQDDLVWMAEKVTGLRIFSDDAGKMNLSVADTQGGILAVSQFTLYGSTKKGKRPSFVAAAPPEVAKPLFDEFVVLLRARLSHVETGIFGAKMSVDLQNDGPVTLIVER